MENKYHDSMVQGVSMVVMCTIALFVHHFSVDLFYIMSVAFILRGIWLIGVYLVKA